ncbi:uncharacterized protein METZ01_LOCUS225344, partial [marine metagenome]
QRACPQYPARPGRQRHHLSPHRRRHHPLAILRHHPIRARRKLLRRLRQFQSPHHPFPRRRRGRPARALHPARPARPGRRTDHHLHLARRFHQRHHTLPRRPREGGLRIRRARSNLRLRSSSGKRGRSLDTDLPRRPGPMDHHLQRQPRAYLPHHPVRRLLHHPDLLPGRRSHRIPGTPSHRDRPRRDHAYLRLRRQGTSHRLHPAPRKPDHPHPDRLRRPRAPPARHRPAHPELPQRTTPLHHLDDPRRHPFGDRLPRKRLHPNQPPSPGRGRYADPGLPQRGHLPCPVRRRAPPRPAHPPARLRPARDLLRLCQPARARLRDQLRLRLLRARSFNHRLPDRDHHHRVLPRERHPHPNHRPRRPGHHPRLRRHGTPSLGRPARRPRCQRHGPHQRHPLVPLPNRPAQSHLGRPSHPHPPSLRRARKAHRAENLPRPRIRGRTHRSHPRAPVHPLDLRQRDRQPPAKARPPRKWPHLRLHPRGQDRNPPTGSRDHHHLRLP